MRIRWHRLARITTAMEKGNGATHGKEDGATREGDPSGCIFGKKDWATAFSRLCGLGVFLGLEAILGFGTWSLTRCLMRGGAGEFPPRRDGRAG